MNEIIYTEDELKGLADAEILDLLAKSWGIDDGVFEVWGELPPLGDTSFGFLRNPYLVKTGDRLYYPLQGHEQEPCRFFVAPQDASRYGSKTKQRFIRCELELSPESERVKHNNPFSLCVKKGSGENLRYLPKEIPQEILIDPHSDNERSQFISKSIYDFYSEKAIGDIDKEIKQRKNELEQRLSEQENEANKLLVESREALNKTEEKRDVVKKLVDTLNARQKELEKITEKLTQDKEVKHQEIQMLTKRFEQIEAEMNNKIKRLKSYVADKALFLKTFEFVDEEDLELFLLESKPQSQVVDGVSFSEILNGDYQKAVSYIQAHLVSKDILYPRHIIENYLTLLRTKDLIILAGDSGSGKTNLVKSFAKAVGGKSIIVPVKPNWTSSEDLLGYYNPLEKKYLATPFLEAMIEAQQNPEIPYFICLDEMNLARVEYYFADFLSLLETRDEDPEISLYAEDESAHVLSELKAVVDIIQSTKDKYSQNGVVNFIELLKDEKLNSQLRLAFGFSDKDSLIKYHNEIRRMLSAVMTMPSSIKMPANIHIIGAINIDETTHYLSPKILDRAHIMRFESPLLSDWDEILAEVSEYEFDDISKPLIFNIDALGYRANYPKFDRENPFCKLFIELNKEFFHKLGIEFGMRTIRQGLNYLDLFQDVNSDDEMAINNFLLHKVLPKLTFDGNKHVGEQTKLELIERVFVERLKQQLPNHENYSEIFSSIHALENVVRNAKANDGIVNFCVIMMNPFFEIKYLELKWYDQKTLTKVTESLVSLDVEYDEERDLFQVETTIYPKVEGLKKGLLAIRFLNQKSDKPYIEMPNGEKNYLTPIKDPETGMNWWIAKDQWVKEHKQWSSIAPNIVGAIRLILQGKVCEIAINGSDFTLDQLEQYLRTFKNDLWELILDENTAVQAKAKEGQTIGIGEEAIECITNLADHAEKVLKNLKVELREIQTLKPRKMVKPVNRTFMELATKTNQRFLTSRATEPSYNVAENRYIFFALERCYRIIKQIVILADNKKQRFQHMVEKLQAQHDAFKDYVKVDRDLVVSDLKKIGERRRLEYWQKKLDQEIKDIGLDLNSSSSSQDVFFKLVKTTTNLHNSEPDGFFILVWNGENWEKPQNKSGVLRLSQNFSELINIFKPGMVLKINGKYMQRSTERSVQFEFSNIQEIELLDFLDIHKAKESYENEKAIGIKLAANDWLKPLSKQELEEQEKEKIALRNRIRFYTENQKLCGYVFEKVEPKFRLIKEILKQLKSLGIKASSYFPNSMTFVQNPNYQGVHNNYKVLRNVTNLHDENLLISLEKIDEIGLVNMPLLYERWTLIQIILVLKETFRFIPQDDWKYKIIDAIKSNQEDIQVNLSNEGAKRYITLWYEKRLLNNKKPDFTLDLTWFKENDIENKNGQFKRFVLDAKFYDKNTFNKAGGMMSKINELYEHKNYSEDDQNPVFLVHPCKNLIDQQVTAQEWGKYSFLGELDCLNDDIFYSHNKGAIFLNPIDRNLYSDELQRLLGMFLQYKLETSETDPNNDRTFAVPICIRCGSNHIVKIEKSSGYYNKVGEWIKRTPRSVWMQCVECEQMQIYNHCSSKTQNSTRLIKNGLYWSYHSARALEPFNMKCPECGAWGAW